MVQMVLLEKEQSHESLTTSGLMSPGTMEEAIVTEREQKESLI